MKKVILTYGIISGLIVAAMIFITIPLYDNGMLKVEYGEIVGYSSMLVALSLVFFGVKSYRDNYQHGVISFGVALKVGLLIALVSALIYAIAWEINYDFISTNFMEEVSKYYVEKAKSSGFTEAKLKDELQKIDDYKRLYHNFAFRFGMTLAEILPVGIVIALASAAILRKKTVLPAN